MLRPALAFAVSLSICTVKLVVHAQCYLAMTVIGLDNRDLVIRVDVSVEMGSPMEWA